MWSHLPWHAEQAPGSAKGNASAGLLTVVWTSQGLQSGSVHQRLILRQGTRIPRNQARKRQTRCAAPSKSSAFLGTVGQRQAVEEAAKHLPLGGVGRVRVGTLGPMSASTWASSAEGCRPGGDSAGTRTSPHRNWVGRSVPLMSVMAVFLGTPR